MPHGMKLRSPWIATHIAHPRGGLTLDDLFPRSRLDVPKLLPLETVSSITGSGFSSTSRPTSTAARLCGSSRTMTASAWVLANGEAVAARRVVVAAGLLGP